MHTFIFFFKEEDAIDIRRMILSGCTTRVLYIDGAYLEHGELALWTDKVSGSVCKWAAVLS
jgi:hypothetical protein